LGLPKFENSKYFHKQTPVGVITGLAYTPMGGCTLYIEASKSNFDNDAKKDKLNKGSLIVTGNLQDVMKESCQLAYSYAKYILATYFKNDFLERNDVHLNFP
jgi:Lon-like ATP-dependent protease